MSGGLEFDGGDAPREMSVTRGPVVTFAQLRSDIMRQRRWVLLAGLLGLLLGVAGWFLTPSTYTATSVVTLYSLPDSPLQASAAQRVNPATERQVGQSSEVVQAVSTHVPRTPGQVRAALAVEVPVDSAALRFAYTDEDEELAAEAADAAATAYLDLRNAAYEETIDSAVQRTDRQIQDLEEQQIEVAGQVSGAADPGAAARAQQRYDQIGTLLGELRGQRSELQAGSVVGGRLVSPASVPRDSNGLSLPGWAVAGLGFGLLLGCAYAVARGQLDRRIHTRAHLEAVTGLRTLADLSVPGQNLERASALLLAHHRTEPMSPLVLAGCAVTHGQATALDLAAQMRTYGATVKLIGTHDIPESLDDAEIYLVDAISVSKGETLLWAAAGNGVVIVARQSVTGFGDVTELLRELQGLGVPLLGTILLSNDASRVDSNRRRAEERSADTAPAATIPAAEVPASGAGTDTATPPPAPAVDSPRGAGEPPRPAAGSAPRVG